MAYVLVVDDAPDCADAVCGLLRRSGHETAAALNGGEALTRILQRAPDLVVLDLAMPNMNGADLLAVLRSYLRLQHLPVIVYAAQGESLLARRARGLGVRDVLVKAKTSPLDLVERINQEFSSDDEPD